MKKIAFGLALFLLFSCDNKDDDSAIREAESLFQETVTLISDYTAKVKNSKDSAEIDILNSEFEKKLTDINFSYPPNTDLLLTEQDNDSIFKLMNTLKETQKETLGRFHKHYLQTLQTEDDNQ